MKGLKILPGLLHLIVTFPIWYYLLYQVLVRVQASELMWFLFWVYMPVHLVAGAISRWFESPR